MERKDVFLLIIIAVIALLYLTKMYETFTSGSYDITPAITVGMDWKGSQISKIPFYPNNLINPSTNTDIKMKKLQAYEQNIDGETNTGYVSSNMKNNKNMNNQNVPNNLEGFTMMNPYISA